MGGGDLNMKKHFHPLTMENLERVWKAEEKKRLEEERIKQLSEELRQERQREELQRQAVESGLLKKKTEKLDWMYSHAQTVNTEAYLLGKKIDANVEGMKDEGPKVDIVQARKVSTPKASDILAKVKEDPLFLIKKKEEENRRELLQNPMKMKKIRAMLEEKVTKELEKKSKKSKKKHKRSRNPSSERDSLPPTFRRRKQEQSSSEDDMNGRKSSSRRKDYRQNSSHEHDRYWDERFDSRVNNQSNGRVGNRNDIEDSVAKCSHKYKDNRDKYRDHNKSNDKDNHRYPINNKGHRNKFDNRDSIEKRGDPRNFTHSDRKRSGEKYEDSRSHKKSRRNSTSGSSESESGDEKMEAKRREMLQNAEWRQKQREKNFHRFKEETNVEEKMKASRSKQNVVEDKATFIKKLQIASFSSQETASVEDRIRRTIHSKQRTNASLNKKFTAR